MTYHFIYHFMLLQNRMQKPFFLSEGSVFLYFESVSYINHITMILELIKLTRIGYNQDWVNYEGIQPEVHRS